MMLRLSLCFHFDALFLLSLILQAAHAFDTTFDHEWDGNWEFAHPVIQVLFLIRFGLRHFG